MNLGGFIPRDCREVVTPAEAGIQRGGGVGYRFECATITRVDTSVLARSGHVPFAQPSRRYPALPLKWELELPTISALRVTLISSERIIL